MHISRFVVNTVCIFCNCLIVVGFALDSSSSSPSSAWISVFRFLMGRSSVSGRREMIWRLVKKPISPLRQYLNCFLRNVSEPCSSIGGFRLLVLSWYCASSCALSHAMSRENFEPDMIDVVSVPKATDDPPDCLASFTAWYSLIAHNFENSAA